MSRSMDKLDFLTISSVTSCFWSRRVSTHWLTRITNREQGILTAPTWATAWLVSRLVKR